MAVDMVYRSATGIGSWNPSFAFRLPSTPVPPATASGYTRARKIADGSYVTWQSNVVPDLLMTDCPGSPNPADYADFVVVL